MAVESPWQPINLGMKCASDWVAYCSTPGSLKKVGKTLLTNKNSTLDGDLDKEFLILTLL